MSKGLEVGNDPPCMFWDYHGVRPAVLGTTLRVREHCGAVRGQDIFERASGHSTGDSGKRGGDE